MNYAVELSRDAARYLRRLSKVHQQRVALRISQIATEPYGPYTKPLTNVAGRRAARVGDYRIVFAVDDEDRMIRISDIGPRGRVYRDL